MTDCVLVGIIPREREGETDDQSRERGPIAGAVCLEGGMGLRAQMEWSASTANEQFGHSSRGKAEDNGTDVIRCIAVVLGVCGSSLLSSFMGKNHQQKQVGEGVVQRLESLRREQKMRTSREVKGSYSGALCLGLNLGSATHQLCAFSQVILPFCISFSSSVNQTNKITKSACEN